MKYFMVLFACAGLSVLAGCTTTETRTTTTETTTTRQPSATVPSLDRSMNERMPDRGPR